LDEKMVLMETRYAILGQFKLGLVVAAMVLLSACQSSPQQGSRAPIEGPGQEIPHPDSRDYPQTYPSETPSGAPGDRPSTGRPPEPPSVDAVIDSIETDAKTFMAQKQWKKSLEAAEHGLRIDRRNAEFYRIMGESYRQLGDIPQAQRFALQAQRYCRHACGETQRLLKSLNLR
jgi:tetratricopeptide (TPR) repeat protein